mmetsp:Transcript_22759/g.54153  ORF Transcript_22759/g.54153 Transcript_22759/m.54153 type:complete len:305 (+) Transcript_22759:229-1143(+)
MPRVVCPSMETRKSPCCTCGRFAAGPVSVTCLIDSSPLAERSIKTPMPHMPSFTAVLAMVLAMVLALSLEAGADDRPCCCQEACSALGFCHSPDDCIVLCIGLGVRSRDAGIDVAVCCCGCCCCCCWGAARPPRPPPRAPPRAPRWGEMMPRLAATLARRLLDVAATRDWIAFPRRATPTCRALPAAGAFLGVAFLVPAATRAFAFARTFLAAASAFIVTGSLTALALAPFLPTLTPACAFAGDLPPLPAGFFLSLFTTSARSMSSFISDDISAYNFCWSLGSRVSGAPATDRARRTPLLLLRR